MSLSDLPLLRIAVGDLEDRPTRPPSTQWGYWAVERRNDAPYYHYRLYLATQAGTWEEVLLRRNAFTDGFSAGFQGIATGGVVIINEGGGASAGVNAEEIEFAYNGSFPIDIVEVEPDALILEIRLIIESAFNGMGSFTVGDPADSDRLMLTSENAPGTVGIYSTNPDYRYLVTNTVRLYSSMTGATQGSGRLVMVYRV